MKMNMIGHKMTFKLFYLHFFEKCCDDFSEIFFVFSIDDSFTKLWTKYYVIGTIPSDVRSM